jgi:hypothetical protein
MSKGKHSFAHASGMRGSEKKVDPATPGDSSELMHASAAVAAPVPSAGVPLDSAGADPLAYSSGMRGLDKPTPKAGLAVKGAKTATTPAEHGASLERAASDRQPKPVSEDGEDYVIRVPKAHFGKK